MAVTRMTDLVGRVLGGRYRLVAPIGAGASAQVFLADDTRLRRRVAVKVLHAALADDAGFLRRFRAEAQAAAALNHPHLLAVYDWGEDDGTPYLVTEYLAGGSLRAILDSGYRLSPSQALLVGLEASRALDAAHRRGFVHRDIKPANLLFGEDGRLRIADFGLARALAEAAWTEPAGAVVGTARYASPEQVRGDTVDGRADVYSLALVLIEAVTGRVPFAADTTIATLMARVDRAVEVPEGLGPLRKVLARAGQPDPDERPDAGELAVGLMAAAEDLPRPDALPLAGAIARVDLSTSGQDLTSLPSTTRPPAAGDADDDDVTVVGAAAAAADLPSGSGAPVTVAVAVDPEVDPFGGGGAVAPVDGRRARGEAGPRRRRRWPKVLLGVVLVAAVATAGVLTWLVLQPPTHEVPVLASRAAAEAAAEEFGWTLDVAEARRDGTAPGDVLEQTPAAGEQLEEGATLFVTVSAGQELRIVPEGLVGVPVAQAAAALESAGLVASAPQPRFDENAAVDTVLETQPAAGGELETGSEVVVIVSAGPAPRVVPEIGAGSDPAAACAALEAVQLVCTQVQVYADDVAAGGVVGTEPDSGVETPRGTEVRVFVSLGPELLPVPGVAGQSVASATAALEAAGFPVVGVSGNPAAPVTGTDPAAGTSVRRGTGVTLITR